MRSPSRDAATGSAVLLARRPGDRRRDGDRRVFLAHTGAESRWIEQFDLPDGRPERALDLDLGASPSPTPPASATPARRA